MTSSDQTQVGANRFFLNDAWHPIDECLFANRGYYVSTRPAMVGPLLNINNATSAFLHPIRVSDFIKSFLRIKSNEFYPGITLSEFQVRTLNSILKGVKAKITFAQSATKKTVRLNDNQSQSKRIAYLGKSLIAKRSVLPGTSSDDPQSIIFDKGVNSYQLQSIDCHNSTNDVC